MAIPVRNIFYLLSYAWNRLEEANRLNISLDDYSSSLNLLTRVLVNGTKHLLKRGLDKSYVEIQDDYPGIKGKINFNSTLNKQLFWQGKANCSFDEFSDDVLHNQILKTTLSRLLSYPDLDTKLREEVRECYFRFQHVHEISLSITHFDKVKIHRNNYAYDLLLRIARMIFENSTVDEKSGEFKFLDFTRNEKAMAALFEDFVRNFYAKEQMRYKVRREDIKWQAEPIDDSDINLLPKMQTDISLESFNHKLVIDTKYYQNTMSAYYDSEKFHSGNLYQLHAYIVNLEKDMRNVNNSDCDGILLYPTTQKEIDESYRMGSHTLRIATVNLNKEWNYIHDRLLALLSTYP